MMMKMHDEEFGINLKGPLGASMNSAWKTMPDKPNFCFRQIYSVIKLDDWLHTNCIFFSSRTIGQIFYTIPWNKKQKYGENITTNKYIVASLETTLKGYWLVSGFQS